MSLDFVERLVSDGGRVRVPTTLNRRVRRPDPPGAVPGRGCDPHRWSQADAGGTGPRLRADLHLRALPVHRRPRLGAQVAWAESNAIVFANSVLGARTNRYGDFIDLCCAITGRVPYYGLHRTENRRARVVIDVQSVPPDGTIPPRPPWPSAMSSTALRRPRPGRGRAAQSMSEDDLKALGAVAASSGAAALIMWSA